MKLREIAERLDAVFHGDGNHEISGVESIEAAQSDQITFLANEKYAKHLKQTQAGAVILKEKLEISGLNMLIHPDPYYAFARCLRLFHPMPQQHLQTGVDSNAVVLSDTTVADSAHIGAFVHVGSGSEIGDDTRILTNSVIGRNCKIGRNCLIYPNVTIYDDTIIGDNVSIHAGAVIGSDGYGYAQHDGIHYKVLQVGRVRIENDVEIGANTTIDRAAMGETVIGQGTKIDNLVQVAHNVRVGKGSLLVAQSGVSGSTKLGEYVILAGQAGLVGHITVGDRVVVAAQAGVANNLESDKMFSGSPAREIRAWRKIEANLSRLPDRMKELRELRHRIEELSTRLDDLTQAE